MVLLQLSAEGDRRVEIPSFFNIKTNNMSEKIICAAILLPETGKVYYGHRHPHCIEAMNGELSWTMSRQQIRYVTKTQGFVTSLGRFVDRVEALAIALANNQVVYQKEMGDNELYSEDLY
jgi:hypothetical protein